MKYRYALIQLSSWGLLYTLMALAVYHRPVFVKTELLYGAVLLGGTALGSHALHLLYQRFLTQANVSRQVLFLALGSAVAAAVATAMLLLCFFALSLTGVTFPIPSDQRWFVIKTVFSGNFVNMLMALLLWSAVYFAITKVRQLRQTTALLHQTQLDALISQLNPHFLFNAINNIRALILEDPERSRAMLASLSDMLRYNLNSTDGVKVSLQQELETVRRYISLCSIQFEQRLHYREQLPEGCLTLLVPKLLLQLCVENAIKHGISSLPDGGEVLISAEVKPECLVLNVTNPGRLAEGKKGGVGLDNIRRRLQLLYQGKARVRLYQHQLQVITEITLPLESAE